ncbi:sulfatase [Halorhabdus utahensis DSM 12940]|uniref:Sulfatase n=1 Tax=Halorhabdus utahensis (strain DSM 12940 / JCM 11049 / AX-2) TaxID=519442 RepID=C7NM45_HALUD|nr:sulfatase [Halorhabdus utahensis]ACV11253.1 sulfatase [Halorhabdus utahensis DSM 12940]
MKHSDIIWVTLDSVRADHTSLSQSDRAKTPHLESVGEIGTAFGECHSHDIWTRSSTASILTGHPPSAHRTWSNSAKLPEQITTIPESLSEQGYRTACVTSNGQISQSTGLGRGFDAFHFINRDTVVQEAGLRSVIKWLTKIRSHSIGLSTAANEHCVGYLSTQIAKRHISNSQGADHPLFLYTHLNDSHHPYIPPGMWESAVSEDLSISVERAEEIARDMSNNLHERIADDDPYSETEWEVLRVLYDALVEYVDHLTGEIISTAREQLQDPIIVVTGDHGEFFGYRGLLAHMLEPSTQVSNVPLAVEGIRGLEDTGLVQHSDVMKTILEDVGVDHSVPAGVDIRDTPREYAFVQRGQDRAEQKLEQIKQHNSDFSDSHYPKATVTSMITPTYRFEVSEESARLYDLPDESNDVSDEYADLVAEFRERYEEWKTDVGEPVGDVRKAEFDEQMKKQLRGLGYLQE